MGEKLENVYDELSDMLSQAASVHCDETGWRVGTASAWLWVFSNAETTLCRIEQSRGHQVVLDVLGENFAGILHSDRAKVYDHKALSNWLKQTPC